MSLNLDMFELESPREALKRSIDGGTSRMGQLFTTIPIMSEMAELPLALGKSTSRMMVQWYLMQFADVTESILEIGCGAGQNAVMISRTFPRSQVLATDINPAAAECVEILARAAGCDNVGGLQFDLIQSDSDPLPFDNNLTVFGYSILAALPDGGETFLRRLGKSQWSSLILFEPIGNQIGPGSMAGTWPADIGLNQSVWGNLQRFVREHGKLEKLIVDFCGHYRNYAHTLIHITRT